MTNHPNRGYADIVFQDGSRMTLVSRAAVNALHDAGNPEPVGDFFVTGEGRTEYRIHARSPGVSVINASHVRRALHNLGFRV